MTNRESHVIWIWWIHLMQDDECNTYEGFPEGLDVLSTFSKRLMFDHSYRQQYSSFRTNAA